MSTAVYGITTKSFSRTAIINSSKRLIRSLHSSEIKRLFKALFSNRDRVSLSLKFYAKLIDYRVQRNKVLPYLPRIDKPNLVTDAVRAYLNHEISADLTLAIAWCRCGAVVEMLVRFMCYLFIHAELTVAVRKSGENAELNQSKYFNSLAVFERSEVMRAALFEAIRIDKTRENYDKTQTVTHALIRLFSEGVLPDYNQHDQDEKPIQYNRQSDMYIVKQVSPHFLVESVNVCLKEAENEKQMSEQLKKSRR